MMNWLVGFFITMSVLSMPVGAEIFKCKNASGKVVYQPDPCYPGTANQGVVKVKKMTPEETEVAKLKLQAWQDQQASEAIAKKAAEKERQAEVERRESLELQRRSVVAQERQAIVAQQRAVSPVVIPAWDFNQNYRYYAARPPYNYDRHNRSDWQSRPYNPYHIPSFPSYMQQTSPFR